MPLITRVLRPELFTPERVGLLFWEAAKGAGSLQFQQEQANRVMSQLADEGVISRTEILRPALFNAVEIAALRSSGSEEMAGDALRALLDQTQWALDALVQTGVLA